MLQNNSLIVSLSISAWTARKHDKQITDEVATNHNASDDAGRYNKLLAAKKWLEPITKIDGKARTFHYENTLAWGDNNERLLPTKNYFNYIQGIATLKSERDQAVAVFLRSYEAMIAEAKVRLNGMFRQADYPTRNEIEDKFGFRTTFMPVPDTDLRVGLQLSEVNKLKADIEAEINERLAGASKDIWDRIKTQLTHMRDKLADSQAIFRDSLFENLIDLVTLLPRLNVTDDQSIKDICSEMQRLIADPAVVRSNSVVREDKANEAAQILNKFNSFFGN